MEPYLFKHLTGFSKGQIQEVMSYNLISFIPITEAQLKQALNGPTSPLLSPQVRSQLAPK